MIRALWSSRLVKEEEGIVALLTFLFMMTIGIIVLFTLWGLAYTSGAYTTLYGATQAAAYAAASEVRFVPEGGTTSQLPFQCSSTPHCTSGRTSETAKQLLAAALERGPANSGLIRRDGPYGLSYPGTVRLLDENGNGMDGVLAYEVQIPPGAAAELDPACGGSVIDPENGSRTIRTCWVNPFPDFGVQDQNYVSGVVVIAEATIPFVPTCDGLNWSIGDLNVNLCPRVRIRASVPARSGQQQSFSGTNEPFAP